jgi:hypothetical protein
MAPLLVCVQPATGHPEGFLASADPAALLKQLAMRTLITPVTPASQLEVRPAETASTGIAEMDALIGGLPRGCLTEIYGAASSGRTSFLISALAAATERQEVCALVDVSDAFHPQSGLDAGMEFHNLLWVRCDGESRQVKNRNHFRKNEREQLFISPDGRLVSNAVHRNWQTSLEQALKTTDLLLQSGGFGLVAIDLSDVPLEAARRVPLTSWFRFRRAVEKTDTILLAVTRGPCTGTCASLLLRLDASSVIPGCANAPHHAELLRGLTVGCERVRSRLERKPVRPDHITFETKTAWVR